ncbi:carboxyltransferase domain-containing protein [Yoonia sp. SS1-5]|uniref:Allophanate hydrolase subunit 1 n=1 Tax=Yoonia rhodophyticola TaxID=3137370 RepID=A0AAN0M9F6_9RHOB
MSEETSPAFLPLGIDGILVRFSRELTAETNAQALAFRDAVMAADLPGTAEIASSLTSVRVGFDPEKTNRHAVTDALAKIVAKLKVTDAGPRRIWHIPVSFAPAHAPQLAEAAALAGLTTSEAAAQITAARPRVIAIGFAPGQPYLGMLPSHWDIPRQTALTARVPPGALVVAVRQLIIFAADAPTGWRHIGQTAFQVYRPDAAEPFAFAPGDAVSFHQITDTELTSLQATGDPDGGATCEHVT